MLLCVIGMGDEIYEIRIRKTSELSPEAQNEVAEKLSGMADHFNYRGYAKITYSHESPIKMIGVDPIEGTIVDFFKENYPQI